MGIAAQAYGQQVAFADLVISEILFNPVKDGFDYIEGFNRSDHPIALETILLANRNSSGEITQIKPVTRSPLIVRAGSYFVVTENEKWLRQHYRIPSGALVCQAPLPSLPDEEGTLIFLNIEDSIVDELNYQSAWHFSLLTDVAGVALERLNTELPAQNKNNWASASSASGYGTPGYQNSQRVPMLPGTDRITIQPKVFSPDNDGVNDFILLHITLEEPGFVMNTIVYDMSGRKIRWLLKNETIGMDGQYKWDGLDDQSLPLPQGMYILVSELYNLRGQTRKFKNAVTLVRR